MNNILNMEHISKIYGDKVIFDDITCGIHQGDKIGIIGINGTGKTTFLRILAGLEEPDGGQVILQNGLRLSFLPQHPEFPEGETVLSYVAGQKREEDWTPETDARMVLNRLGIADHEEKIDHLSGGQKKRVALAAVLVNPADVLILDEPTNHLDNEMAAWLEEYLNAYKGAVIMVTHDRYFLDRVTNKILEISHGKIYMYEAKYSRFLELKAEREEMEAASWRKRNSILRMEMEWAKRGCRARSTKQRARLERLEALKNAAGPAADQKVEIDSVETRMGKKTIELHHIFKSFGEKVCIRDFDYIVLKNQRLGIIGPNGLRQIHSSEDHCRDHGAGQRFCGTGRDDKDRLFFPGAGGDEHQPESDRLHKRCGGIYSHKRRTDQRVETSGTVSFRFFHAVFSHRKAFRRRKETASSSESPCRGAQCAAS